MVSLPAHVDHHTAQGHGVGPSTFKPLPVMYCVGAAGTWNHLPKLILVPTATTGGSVLLYFFHAGIGFSIENVYFGYFVVNLRTFRCTFKYLDSAVVYQNGKI